MKLALAVICKGNDEEALLLEECLDNIVPHVDSVFITFTHKRDEPKYIPTREIILKQNISHFEWCNDFAKARNFNFSQVPKEYTHILWCDADDNFRGLDNLKSILEKFPHIDVFSMNYLYHFNEFKQADVVHMKTMVVKNDGCVEWAGALHEDFKENRQIVRYFIKDIERIHLSNDERMNMAKVRNIEVSKSDLENNPDDPRCYWNLGNSYLGHGDYTQALDTLLTFISLSHSDEEKYLTYINISKICDSIAQKNKSIEYGRMAIGIRPEYPDAYHSLAQIMFNNGDYREAEKLLLLGLTKKPPYYSIIVFNPRDYDFSPLMLLAKTYYQLARPDQAITCLEGCLKIQPKNGMVIEMLKLLKKDNKKFQAVVAILEKARKLKSKSGIKKLIDSVPKELQSHPGICNLRNIHFPKTESSGKDLVYYCGFTQEEWTPHTAKTKGIGGSEEAVIWLTNMLAEDGWNVTVYNNCGHKQQKFGKVLYKPFWEWNYRDKQDIVIVWRNPQVLNYEINAPKVFLDMHDVIPTGEFTPERISRMTRVFFKSRYQRELYPQVPQEKCVIVPNGIDSALFKKDVERDNNLIINTSAPNRGIYVLTHMFKEIKRRHPEARLQWAYGWNTFNNGYADNPTVLAWRDSLIAEMEANGVEVLGRLSHGEVANLYLKAGIFAYPTGFAEIDCISMSKAMAAGCYPVTTDFAAIGEKQGHGGIFIHTDEETNNWGKPNKDDFSLTDKQQIQDSIDAIVECLKNPPTDREEMREWAQTVYEWKNIYKIWQSWINAPL